ncbi:hypothetical protein DFO66_10594 [Brevibacterium sanguinis]|uniref:Very-short-patch-repair endonuclease n=2 Tax=Brevibacterium TaxID=1696 RepID=A0A366IHF5_9MICO|nr:hypothetical protein DFO66_10594 [Brevibacterium sanguinis]RBP71251.1 hypothetical protein DFO65_10694 [Brevibacterium celere]
MDGLYELRDYPVLFRTREAANRGISRYRLRFDSRFAPLVRGVHSDPRERQELWTPVWADSAWMEESLRLRAAEMAVSGIGAACFTAARLLGMPLPNRAHDSALHLVTTDWDRKIARTGIRAYRHRGTAVERWIGLPFGRPADMFIDLAEVLTVDELIAVGDAMVGPWHGPAIYRLEELRGYVIGRKYLRQRQKLERALGMVRSGVDSPQETRLRLWVVARGFPEPEVHPRIFSPYLNRVIEPDLGYRDRRLALEYEGDHHRSSPAQWDSDIRRDEGLRRLGWVVFRVTARTNLAELERQIGDHLGAGT